MLDRHVAVLHLLHGLAVHRRTLFARRTIAAFALAFAVTAPAAATTAAATATTVSIGAAFGTITFRTSTFSLFAVRGLA